MMRPELSHLIVLTRYFVGFDVHRDHMTASVYEQVGRRFCYQTECPANSFGRLHRVIDLVRSRFDEPLCCYDASSCGYILYRSLREVGVKCAVIAPGSIPKRSGDRITTDQRDSDRLAEHFAVELLTACSVPEKALESARGLVRHRTDRVTDLHRLKVRLPGLLQTHGSVSPHGRPWTQKFFNWLNSVELNDPNVEFVLRRHLNTMEFVQSELRETDEKIADVAAHPRFKSQVQTLQGFRGIAAAMQLVCELGDIRCFEHPRALIDYVGFVPFQRSSGATVRYDHITKTGNRNARTALVSVALKKRQEHCSPRTTAISNRAHKRLYKC